MISRLQFSIYFGKNVDLLLRTMFPDAKANWLHNIQENRHMSFTNSCPPVFSSSFLFSELVWLLWLCAVLCIIRT